MNKPDAISVLYEISQTLNRGLDLKASLNHVLLTVSDVLAAVHGVICIQNPMRNEIRIEVSHSALDTGSAKVLHQVAQGVSARVIDAGHAILIPDISKDPNAAESVDAGFPNGLTALSLICVPLTKGRRVIGVASLFSPQESPDALGESQKILSIVATMISRQVTQLEAIRIAKGKRIAADKKQLPGPHTHIQKDIIGNSNKMREVFLMISQVSDSNATVLVRGESGTGKELVANAIHNHSRRVKKSIVKINCAALPANLIESELFGHEKGAFTGAVRQKPGKFELANRGTIFLDEIGSIDLSVQVKLLRVLQEKEFERVGGQRARKVDVRVVAATNKNLEKAVEDGSFRGDLYYRLNVFPIYLPPLRERKTDILLLADFFLEKYAAENRKEIRRLSTPAIDMLMAYHWPGNVRELENCIERAVLICDQGVVHSYHLPPTLQTGEQSGTLPALTLEDAVANLEKEMIVDALKNASGNITVAAQMLGTTVRKFSYKAKKHRVDYRQYR